MILYWYVHYVFVHESDIFIMITLPLGKLINFLSALDCQSRCVQRKTIASDKHHPTFTMKFLHVSLPHHKIFNDTDQMCAWAAPLLCV